MYLNLNMQKTKEYISANIDKKDVSRYLQSLLKHPNKNIIADVILHHIPQELLIKILFLNDELKPKFSIGQTLLYPLSYVYYSYNLNESMSKGYMTEKDIRVTLKNYIKETQQYECSMTFIDKSGTKTERTDFYSENLLMLDSENEYIE